MPRPTVLERLVVNALWPRLVRGDWSMERSVRHIYARPSTRRLRYLAVGRPGPRRTHVTEEAPHITRGARHLARLVQYHRVLRIPHLDDPVQLAVLVAVVPPDRHAGIPHEHWVMLRRYAFDVALARLDAYTRAGIAAAIEDVTPRAPVPTPYVWCPVSGQQRLRCRDDEHTLADDVLAFLHVLARHALVTPAGGGARVHLHRRGPIRGWWARAPR